MDKAVYHQAGVRHAPVSTCRVLLVQHASQQHREPRRFDLCPCVCLFVLPVCCSAADARAAELTAATEALDAREQQLQEREAAVQAATADLEGREAQLAQQKEDMAVQEVSIVHPCQTHMPSMAALPGCLVAVHKGVGLTFWC